MRRQNYWEVFEAKQAFYVDIFNSDQFLMINKYVEHLVMMI